MPKTLAELRAERPRSRPERVVPLCLAPHLVAEVQSLIEDLEDLPVSAARSRSEDDGPPPRMGDGDVEDPRGADIRARLAEVFAEMAEHEGQLKLRAGDDGDWRLWVNAHPARGEDMVAEHQRDREIALGYCDADALIADLGKYAYSWQDEVLEDGDWDVVFAPNLAGPDKKQLAQTVVTMYERVTDVPKWVSALSATLRNWPAANEPAPSADPPPSTSDESQPSDTSTTAPTTS